MNDGHASLAPVINNSWIYPQQDRSCRLLPVIATIGREASQQPIRINDVRDISSNFHLMFASTWACRVLRVFDALRDSY